MKSVMAWFVKEDNGDASSSFFLKLTEDDLLSTFCLDLGRDTGLSLAGVGGSLNSDLFEYCLVVLLI